MDCLFIQIGICFVEASSENKTAFDIGLAELLTAIAILLVAYNTVDERYKFRIAISNIPIPKILFGMLLLTVAAVIAVPLWFEFKLPIPIIFNNPLYFEIAVLVLLLFPIIYWLYVAFINPPIFSTRNALKFANRLFHTISSGDERQIVALAYEVGNSAEEIVKTAKAYNRVQDFKNGGFTNISPQETKVANEIILMLGDRRFCKAVVASAPGVAADLFHYVAKNGLGEIPFSQFSTNVSTEFFANKNSAIYHEDEGYFSGLIGYEKPISRDLFGHVSLVEGLASQGGSPFVGSFIVSSQWDATSFQAYNRVVKIYFQQYFQSDYYRNHSYAVNQIISDYEHICLDAHEINNMDDGYYHSLQYHKIKIVVNFINDILEILEDKKIYASNKSPDTNKANPNADIYDQLARLTTELMFQVGTVQTKDFKGWAVQHNLFWSGLVKGFDTTRARKVFVSRLQRSVLRELSDMHDHMNFKNARILGLCLNVLGLDETKGINRTKTYRAFKKLILKKTKAHYLNIYYQQPKVAEACLSGTISFDANTECLIKTYSEDLSGNAAKEILQLNVPPKITKRAKK